jgi:hypothetical protein
MTPQHSVCPEDQLADASRAQRLTADQRANAADRKEVRRRYGPAAPEKQRHHTEAVAAGIDGKRPEIVSHCIGQRTKEEPVMVTGHPDALANFGFVRLLVS